MTRLTQSLPPLPTFQLSETRAHVRQLLRWLAMLTPVAVGAGTVSAAFLWSLEEATKLRFERPWLLWLLPVVGVAVAALYWRFGKEIEGGNNLVIQRLREPVGGIPARITPLIFVGTVASHVVGASVGREGTAVQMGAGVASACNRLFRLTDAELRTLLMAGVAAGFGAVFGTPIAGAVFAIEVVAVGRLAYGAFVPALYAALAADFVAGAWGAHHTHYAIVVPDPGGHMPFDGLLMLKVVVAAAVFGVVASGFVALAGEFAAVLRRFVDNPVLRPVVGGALTIALVYALGTREYLGLGILAEHAGDVTIPSAFVDGGADPFSWWWKVAFTVLAVGSGFKGGEVTPLFFIGATLGNRLAGLLRAPVDLMAGVGFVAVFGAAANVPLACAVMGIELFGAGVAPYLAAGCFVAHLVSGRASLYAAHREA